MAIVIPYVKQTWTDGSGGGTPISAARLGVLEEGILDVSLAPAARVFHNATQSIPNNTITNLAFNSELIDQAGGTADTMHDNVTNNSRFTCRYAGVYLMGGHINWAGNPVQSYLEILLNGTSSISLDYFQSTTNVSYHLTSSMYPLAVNDFVQLRVFQLSGAALNVQANVCVFWMVRVA